MIMGAVHCGRHRRCWDTFTMFCSTDKPSGILHRVFSWVGILPMSRDPTILCSGEATSYPSIHESPKDENRRARRNFAVLSSICGLN